MITSAVACKLTLNNQTTFWRATISKIFRYDHFRKVLCTDLHLRRVGSLASSQGLLTPPVRQLTCRPGISSNTSFPASSIALSPSQSCQTPNEYFNLNHCSALYLFVQRLLLQRDNLPILIPVAEPSAFLWYDHVVILELDQYEFVKGFQVLYVGLVFLLRCINISRVQKVRRGPIYSK